VGRRDSRADSELGNSSLAEEFLNAHKETSRTIAATVQFVAIPFERELTAAEQDQWDAAQEAAEEAFEHFERVLSEASAFCKNVDEKGGA
jgi:hypothetical protein